MRALLVPVALLAAACSHPSPPAPPAPAPPTQQAYRPPVRWEEPVREIRLVKVVQGKPAGLTVGRATSTTLSVRSEGRSSDYTLDDDGLPVRFSTRPDGGAVDEQYERPAAKLIFHIPIQHDPFTLGLVARWLMRHPNERLPLEPVGEARMEIVGTLDVGGRHLVQVALSGLDHDVVTVWLDENQELAAYVVDELEAHVDERNAADHAAIAAAQSATEARRAEALAARLLHRPPRGLFIRNARLFDSVSLKVIPGQSIFVRGDKIVRVGPDATIPPGAEMLDAAGRFVLPGLWDNHAHLNGRAQGLLELAAGVTTARDMGNERDLPARVARWDAGQEIGPRVVMALRVGTSSLTTAPPARTPAEARALVDEAAHRGYDQIKVVDEIDARLAKIMAGRAHDRGLRFSGHLPMELPLEDFVAAGADELQHVSTLFRGQKGARVYDATVAGRVALLARHEVALDATLSAYDVAAGESGFTRAWLELSPDLPPLSRRNLELGAIPAANQADARASFVSYARAVRAALDAGVVLLPGCDAPVLGLPLHADLAAYVALGVPPARVLRMATFDSAKNMRRDAHSGSIAPGKDADLLLVDGDPTKDIADLRKIRVVIVRGHVLDPTALRDALR